MALDMIMTEMQKFDQQAIDVHGCVWKLRNQRVQMVQGVVRGGGWRAVGGVASLMNVEICTACMCMCVQCVSYVLMCASVFRVVIENVPHPAYEVGGTPSCI